MARRPRAILTMRELKMVASQQRRPGHHGEPSTAYERTTVGLWARSYSRLARERDSAWPARAAAHVLGSSLRGVSNRSALFAHYEAEAVSDFALIHSLLPTAKPLDDVLWQVREAALYRRWLEGGRRRQIADA